MYIIIPSRVPITAGIFDKFNRLCRHHLNGSNRVFLNGNRNLGTDTQALYRKEVIAPQHPGFTLLVRWGPNAKRFTPSIDEVFFTAICVGIASAVFIVYNNLTARLINRIGRTAIIVVIFFNIIIIPSPIPITAGVFNNFNRLCRHHLNGSNRIFNNGNRHLGADA